MKVKSALTALSLATFGFLIVGSTGCKPNKGCTDPAAANYDADAEEDDGSCTSSADQAYADADGVLGGKLYSKFWASETGWTAPSGITATDISGYSNFYRCKQCHGWDLMGTEGAYIDRAPDAGRPSVGISLIEPILNDPKEELFEHVFEPDGRLVNTALTQDGTNGQGNEMPAYATILTEAQAWDIVKFLLEERLDVTQLYDLNTTGVYPNGTRTFTNIGKDGDVAAGNIFYSNNCASCHGADGKQIPIIHDGVVTSVGNAGREAPHELQHKVKFGSLGSSMTGVPDATETDVKNLFKALQDLSTYPD